MPLSLTNLRSPPHDSTSFNFFPECAAPCKCRVPKQSAECREGTREEKASPQGPGLSLAFPSLEKNARVRRRNFHLGLLLTHGIQTKTLGTAGNGGRDSTSSFERGPSRRGKILRGVKHGPQKGLQRKRSLLSQEALSSSPQKALALAFQFLQRGRTFILPSAPLRRTSKKSVPLKS